LAAPSLHDVLVRSERMVGRKVADEFILVPLVGKGADVDAILNLNRVGAFIWERIDGKRDGDAVVDALVGHFEVDRARAAADYLEFVEKLLSVNAVSSSLLPPADPLR
jgi:hypothetical protein